MGIKLIKNIDDDDFFENNFYHHLFNFQFWKILIEISILDPLHYCNHYRSYTKEKFLKSAVILFF